MFKKETTIIVALTVSGLVIFAVGAGFGAFYQATKDIVKNTQSAKVSTQIKTLSSDIIPAVAAYGQVLSINGRDVDLSYNGKTLTINIPEKVSISSFNKGVETVAKFGDIKKGQNLTVALKVSEEGKLIAQTVMILTAGSDFTPPVQK